MISRDLDVYRLAWWDLVFGRVSVHLDFVQVLVIHHATISHVIATVVYIAGLWKTKSQHIIHRQNVMQLKVAPPE